MGVHESLPPNDQILIIFIVTAQPEGVEPLTLLLEKAKDLLFNFASDVQHTGCKGRGQNSFSDDFLISEPKSDEALIRVIPAGICSTEINPSSIVVDEVTLGGPDAVLFHQLLIYWSRRRLNQYA